MNAREKELWWQKTVKALEARDPRIFLGLLTASVLRHGKLTQCSAEHTHVVEKISLEDVMHAAKNYYLSPSVSEFGVIELQVVDKRDVHEQRPT